jgi:hypothetical protein
VPRVEIESSDGSSRLTVEIEPGRGFDDRWKVGLTTADVVATHEFWSGVETLHLAEFFEELARDWKGWAGDKTFSVVEHDLGLRATHDGKGHVLLWVRLGTHGAEDDKTWHVVVPLPLEAGGLERVAARTRRGLTT